MKAICLRLVSSHGIEAQITCDGSQGGHSDYYSVVSINRYLNERRIYGIDPVQAFTLGWAMIEELTRDKRVADDGPGHVAGESWRIESFSP
jgi:hypothetical protein